MLVEVIRHCYEGVFETFRVVPAYGKSGLESSLPAVTPHEENGDSDNDDYGRREYW